MVLGSILSGKFLTLLIGIIAGAINIYGARQIASRMSDDVEDEDEEEEDEDEE